MPFSKKVRKQIGARDSWACQIPGCDRSFQKGWMVHAAHYPGAEPRGSPTHNSPEGGYIACVECHQAVHEAQAQEATTPQQKSFHTRAANLLRGTQRRTRWWQRRK